MLCWGKTDMPIEDSLVIGNSKEQNALKSTIDISVQSCALCLAFNLPRLCILELDYIL